MLLHMQSSSGNNSIVKSALNRFLITFVGVTCYIHSKKKGVKSDLLRFLEFATVGEH